MDGNIVIAKTDHGISGYKLHETSPAVLVIFQELKKNVGTKLWGRILHEGMKSVAQLYDRAESCRWGDDSARGKCAEYDSVGDKSDGDESVGDEGSWK